MLLKPNELIFNFFFILLTASYRQNILDTFQLISNKSVIRIWGRRNEAIRFFFLSPFLHQHIGIAVGDLLIGSQLDERNQLYRCLPNVCKNINRVNTHISYNFAVKMYTDRDSVYCHYVKNKIVNIRNNVTTEQNTIAPNKHTLITTIISGLTHWKNYLFERFLETWIPFGSFFFSAVYVRNSEVWLLLSIFV